MTDEVALFFRISVEFAVNFSKLNVDYIYPEIIIVPAIMINRSRNSRLNDSSSLFVRKNERLSMRPRYLFTSEAAVLRRIVNSQNVAEYRRKWYGKSVNKRKQKREYENKICGPISKYTNYTCYAIDKFILYIYILTDL